MKTYIVKRRGARGGLLKKPTIQRAYGHTEKNGFVYFHQHEHLTDIDCPLLNVSTIASIEEAKGPPDFPYQFID